MSVFYKGKGPQRDEGTAHQLQLHRNGAPPGHVPPDRSKRRASGLCTQRRACGLEGLCAGDPRGGGRVFPPDGSVSVFPQAEKDQQLLIVR